MILIYVVARDVCPRRVESGWRQSVRVDVDELIVLPIPTLERVSPRPYVVVDVQERLAVRCSDLELNGASTPDVLSVPDIEGLAYLDFFAWKVDSVLLFPESVHLQPVLPPLVLVCLPLASRTSLAKRHGSHCMIDNLILSDALLPDIFPTDRANLLGQHLNLTFLRRRHSERH